MQSKGSVRMSTSPATINVTIKISNPLSGLTHRIEAESITFRALCTKVRGLFGYDEERALGFKFEDEEGDECAVTGDAELRGGCPHAALALPFMHPLQHTPRGQAVCDAGRLRTSMLCSYSARCGRVHGRIAEAIAAARERKLTTGSTTASSTAGCYLKLTELETACVPNPIAPRKRQRAAKQGSELATSSAVDGVDGNQDEKDRHASQVAEI